MKILVVKFRNIGDVLLTTPLFANLRAHFPSATIHAAINAESLPIQVLGSRFCRILEIFIKIRFQPVQDRIFHV